MKNSVNTFENFSCVEAYNASALNCYAFRRGTDTKEGIVLSLGNMVSGYPFEIEGIRFENSECAYIAGAFSNGTDAHLDVQRQLAVCTNGFMAKKGIRKPHQADVRSDWESFNVQWMFYVVWQKCLGNSDFRKLLLSLPKDTVIIEDSTFQTGRTATVWGTRNAELKKRINAYKKELKAQGMSKAAIKRALDAKRLGEWSTIGEFVGQNVMGKVLMTCREALVEGVEPAIDYTLLRNAHINLLGKEITFNQAIQEAA